MARWSKTLTPAAMAAFVAALRRGALVEAAAREVGVAISTLYWRRKTDPVFAFAWEAAASLSAEAPGRRLRFAGRRRELFLAAFEASCNTSMSSRATGVAACTVYRHIGRDADFRGDCRTAYRRGTTGLERRAAAERAAARERWASYEIVPVGRPSGDFESIMKRLARWERPDGTIGPRQVRHGRMRRMSFEEAIVLLAKRLRSLEPRWLKD